MLDGSNTPEQAVAQPTDNDTPSSNVQSRIPQKQLTRRSIIHRNKLTQAELNSTKAQLEVSEQAKNEAQLKSMIDPLTGLHNRGWFDEELKRKITDAHRQGKNLWVIIGDIDLFKKINDEFGHPTGDKVLKEFGEMGSREEEPIARIGGEEFAQVISNGLTLTEVQKIISRYSKNFKERAEAVLGREATLSFGVAKLEANETAEDIYSKADKALYHSKEGGRNQATIFEGVSPDGSPIFTNMPFVAAGSTIAPVGTS
jgi:diguanylate cyclase (GGDEF)-like protein